MDGLEVGLVCGIDIVVERKVCHKMAMGKILHTHIHTHIHTYTQLTYLQLAVDAADLPAHQDIPDQVQLDVSV